ncbi:hypothetical protein [Kitasatospora sp. NPDC056184]|uniref:hypothetical protein n=1 Tax=Kitasatospora sp. NPDC056184 TaxID=3345738 RepID=UPI0035DDB97A
MRSAAAMCAGARIRFRRALPVLAVLAGGLGWWLWALWAGPGRLPGGAVPVLLAAGGWGLGLIPVHADWRSTGPARRRADQSAAPVETRWEAGPPAG